MQETYNGQHIVRQNVLNRATEILIAGGLIKELTSSDKIIEVVTQLTWLTDELEGIVLRGKPKGPQTQ